MTSLENTRLTWDVVLHGLHSDKFEESEQYEGNFKYSV